MNSNPNPLGTYPASNTIHIEYISVIPIIIIQIMISVDDELYVDIQKFITRQLSWLVVTSNQWPVLFPLLFLKIIIITSLQRVTCGLDRFLHLQFSILSIVSSKYDIFHFINFEVTYFQIVALNWFCFYLFFFFAPFIHFSFSLSHFFFAAARCLLMSIFGQATA